MSTKPKLDISKLAVTQIIPKLQIIKNDPGLLELKNPAVNFTIELLPLFNLDENAVKIELAITIGLSKGKGVDHPKVAEFSYDFFYEYQNLKDLVDESGELVSDIFLTCSSLSYSTLRGIIFSNSAKSCIENVLLPIVTGRQLVDGSKRTIGV